MRRMVRYKLALALLLCALFSSCDRELFATPSWSKTSSKTSSEETTEDTSRNHSQRENHGESHEEQQKELTLVKAKLKGAKENTVFMYYNLKNYLTMKRGGSEKSKPKEEIQALINNIKQINPDILGVSEIGGQKDLKDLVKRLKKAGIRLPHTHLAKGSDQRRKQAILSKYPIKAHDIPYYSYRINGVEMFVRRGILDASIETPQGTFRFLGVHLKSKRASKEFDQNVVRRNEALILRKHATSLLEAKTQKLVVYGDMNDTKNSPPLRLIRGPYGDKLSLIPIHLEAHDGTRWTHYWEYQDVYSRFDYIFVSRAMRRHIDASASYVQSPKKGDLASDHRALILIMR